MGIYERNYYRDEIPALKPWDKHSMVTNLIIVNVALMLANLLLTSRDNAIVDFLALRTGDLYQPLNWYRLLTYGFVHDPENISHILFNMLSLYFLGQAVEMRYGRWEFLRFYLATIVFGGLIYEVLHMAPGRPAGEVIGASGGVIGVVMLFVFNFPQATLMLWGILPVKAWFIGLITVAVNIFGTQQHVAFDVHLAGILFASIYYYMGAKLSVSRSTLNDLFNRNRKPRLKVHTGQRDTENPSREELEADRILDKIYREGQASLSPLEQQFLEKYSRRVREKRQP